MKDLKLCFYIGLQPTYWTSVCRLIYSFFKYLFSTVLGDEDTEVNKTMIASLTQLAFWYRKKDDKHKLMSDYDNYYGKKKIKLERRRGGY